MIKLIATDMDGTLFDDNKNFPPKFEETLQKLADKGVMFACASGRSYCTLKDNFQDINAPMTYICDNGGYCCDEHHTFFEGGVTNEEIQEVITMCESFNNVKVVLCRNDFAYHNIKPNDPYFDLFKVFYPNNKYCADLHEPKDHFVKVAICDLSGIYTQCAKPITDTFGEKFSVTVTGEHWLDINAKGVNKGRAIKALQEKFNITEDETMTFGDHYNDVEMLQNAKYSFVMENAIDDMKQYGNFIAPSNNEYGVIQMIEKYVLND